MEPLEGESSGDSQGASSDAFAASRIVGPAVSGIDHVGGRFWCLYGDTEDADDDVLRDESLTSLELDRRYRATSSKIKTRSSSRYVKRLLNRQLQRQAALDLEVWDDCEWNVQVTLRANRSLRLLIGQV
jgi:hypothetical protein